MKKKIAVLLCALSLAFCFTGCVNGQQTNTEPSVTEATLSEEENAKSTLKAIRESLLFELTDMDMFLAKMKPTNGNEGSITLTVADGNVTVTLFNLYVDTSKSTSSSYTEAKFVENIQMRLSAIDNGTYKAVIGFTDGSPKIDVQKIG